MKLGPHPKASLGRMMFCAILANTIATLGSANAQAPDAEAAILRAKEAGSSMDFRRIEEALGKLEQDKESDQRKETEQIQRADEFRSFRHELDAARQHGLNERFAVAILELARKHPNALADPQIKNLVNVTTVEVRNFFHASNEEQRAKRVENDLRVIAGQLRIYQSDNGSLPTREQGIEALVTKPTGDPQPSNWRQLLQRVPLDAQGEPYIYRPNGNEFVLASSGPDRQEGSEDDLVFTSSAQEKAE
jgi:type II secretion system protein G